jgi:hypothetical protein
MCARPTPPGHSYSDLVSPSLSLPLACSAAWLHACDLLCPPTTLIGPHAHPTAAIVGLRRRLPHRSTSTPASSGLRCRSPAPACCSPSSCSPMPSPLRWPPSTPMLLPPSYPSTSPCTAACSQPAPLSSVHVSARAPPLALSPHPSTTRVSARAPPTAGASPLLPCVPPCLLAPGLPFKPLL